MGKQMPAAHHLELTALMELSERTGSNPLLTQGSTGNSSVKLGSVLWIKASGKWMADAMRSDIFIPLDLPELVDCLQQGLDPVERYPQASLETPMHAVMPHRVVLHVHSVNAIAWAVRKDAPQQLESRLAGICWQWIPYVSSGMPLAREIELALANCPDAGVFVLGNHGLVIGGGDSEAVDAILQELERRFEIAPRATKPANLPVLNSICSHLGWRLPHDAGMHALATDPVSQSILSGGLLYPCQAIFSGSETSELFRAIPVQHFEDGGYTRYCNRPFVIVEGSGVILNRTTESAEIAMLSGLAQTVQRLSGSDLIRYLTEAEITEGSSQAAHRYRELANASRGI